MTSTIRNPAGAFGAQPDNSKNTLIQVMNVVGAALPGQVMCIIATPGNNNGVSVATTGIAARNQVGICLDTVPATGGLARICLYGPCDNVLKTTGAAITAGDTVGRDATTAGSVSTIAGGTAVTTVATSETGIGIAMADAASAATTCSIFVCKC
jgi:hypothetical protein